MNKAIKIFYDGFYFARETYGGISRMWENLICGLLENSADYECILYAPKNDNRAFQKIINSNANNSHFKWLDECWGLPGRFNGSMRGRALKLGMAMKLSGASSSHIFHSTLNSYPVWVGKTPIVTTVHDLNIQLFPEIFGNGPQIKSFVRADKESICRSKKVVAVSENTKNDIMRLYNIPEGRITVIYHGLNNSFIGVKQKTEKRRGKKYILFVGGRNCYKNYYLLLQAFAKIQHKYDDIHLVAVGPDTSEKDKRSEIDLIEKFSLLEKVHDKGFVSDNELIDLYSNAIALVFPSLYEGFGFPLLEAMACYCPVIASDIPVFRELGKQYVNYFDPKSINELVSRLTAAIESSPDQNKLNMAHHYANTFTWDVAVNKLMSVYRSV